MRALILGGGGATGFAWELGVLEGLRRAGVDVAATSDVLVGTSAGAAAAARVTTGVLSAAYEEQLAAPSPSVESSVSISPIVRTRLALLLARPDSQAKWRGARRLSQSAYESTHLLAAQRRETIRTRVQADGWPDRDLRIAAVDGTAEEFRVLDSATGVSLLKAVEASCALPGVWPPVLIDGRIHVDGAVRSIANADLAVGADRIVVLTPQTLTLNRHHTLSRQVRRTGARSSVIIAADRATRRAIGGRPLDPVRGPAAAANGLRQGAEIASQVALVWC